MIADTYGGLYALDTRLLPAMVPPQLTNPGPQTSVEYVSVVSLPLVATPATPGPLEYSAVGLPPGLSLHPTTGVITGTPLLGSAGFYSVAAFAVGALP